MGGGCGGGTMWDRSVPHEVWANVTPRVSSNLLIFMAGMKFVALLGRRRIRGEKSGVLLNLSGCQQQRSQP